MSTNDGTRHAARMMVELMETNPDMAEPLLLKMLADPLADQILAEMMAKEPTAKAALLKMSTHSTALNAAFARTVMKSEIRRLN